MIKSEKIRLIYGIALSVLTAVVGILFIVQAADIYFGGGSPPYTVESVRAHLTLPIVFLIIWVVAIIGGYVLSVVFPVAKKRQSVRDDAKTAALLKSKVPVSGGEEYLSAKAKIRKLEIIRLVVWCVAYAVMLAGSIVVLVYVFDHNHFHPSDLHSDILGLVRNVLTWVAAGLVAAIAATICEKVTLAKTVAALKTAIAKGDRGELPMRKERTSKAVLAMTIGSAAITLVFIVLYIIAPTIMVAIVQTLSVPATIAIAAVMLAVVIAGILVLTRIRENVPEKPNKIILLCTRVAVGAIAVAFIIAGIFNGGAQDVLIKAIAICTECIGLA